MLWDDRMRAMRFPRVAREHHAASRAFWTPVFVWHGLTLFSLCLIFSPTSLAEVIHLKSGQTIEGKIVERTDKYVCIDFYGTKLTYYQDEIDHIEEGSAKAEEDKKADVSSVQQKHTYSNAELGVSFSVPATWSEDRSPHGTEDEVVVFTHGSKARSRSSISYDFKPLPWHTVSFDLWDYAKSLATSLQWIGAPPTQVERVTVGNKEAAVLSSQKNVPGVITVQIDYFFYDAARKRIHHLQFNSVRASLPGEDSGEENFKADKSDFLSTVNSFSIQ